MSPPYDVIVIGSGITGLTAAKRLVEQGLRVANLEGGLFGGLVTNVNELEGAFAGSGADFASTLMMEVADLGCEAISKEVTGLAASADGVAVTTEAGEHRARAVIVASGAKLTRLGVPGEAELEYKGVSQCADCDGPMYQGQDVVVVGAGDSALQEALVLSHYCARVYVIHHGDAPTARRHWVDALAARDNVTLMPGREVEAIEGEAGVEAVRVRVLRDGAAETLRCSGVFAYIGLAPATQFMPSNVKRDAAGALVVDAAMGTGLPGVYAAGAVRSGFGGTLADAVKDAEAAAAAVMTHVRR
jgi:thioredoxin reductase (NADPH)